MPCCRIGWKKWNSFCCCDDFHNQIENANKTREKKERCCLAFAAAEGWSWSLSQLFLLQLLIFNSFWELRNQSCGLKGFKAELKSEKEKWRKCKSENLRKAERKEQKKFFSFAVRVIEESILPSRVAKWKAVKVENNSKNYVNLYHLIKSNVMPAATMFSKFKSGSQQNQSNPIDANPITQVGDMTCTHMRQRAAKRRVPVTMCVNFISRNWDFVIFPLSLSLILPLLKQYFEIGKPVGCCGPELVWKIHDAYRKNDGKVNNIISLQYLSAQHRRLSSSSFIYSAIPSQSVKSNAHNFLTMNGIFHPRGAAHDLDRSIFVFLSFSSVKLLSLRPSTAHLTCCWSASRFLLFLLCLQSSMSFRFVSRALLTFAVLPRLRPSAFMPKKTMKTHFPNQKPGKFHLVLNERNEKKVESEWAQSDKCRHIFWFTLVRSIKTIIFRFSVCILF